jgi:SAM-dependent methyltransferase
MPLLGPLKRRGAALAMDPPRPLRPLFRLLRDLRWHRATWSSSADQQFHDHAFAGPEHFPFTFAYPGYVTIRRFADLAEPHIQDGGHVLDIGCGPGEITCELASRRRDARFTGIDHSVTAIERARRNAARLGLENVAFYREAAESYAPDRRPDVVMMFDSFHHVSEPGPFVRALARLTNTVFLIEPAGNALGQWDPHLDVDWIPLELDKIRRRVEHELATMRVPAIHGDQAPDGWAGAAVERRYPISEYERLFTGFGLSVQGTLAGFEQYPPEAFAEGALKEHFGRFVYETLVFIETQYIHAKRDLHAKHWAILARKGVPSEVPPFPEPASLPAPAPAVTGGWDIEYLEYDGPREGRAGQRLRGIVRVRNRSWRAWSSTGPSPIHASYHWASGGVVAIRDGLRSGLGGELHEAELRAIGMDIELPPRAGSWELQIDFVEEHVTWFSEQGHSPLLVPFKVRP